VTLLKETQCMPGNPEATVLLHSLRIDGELLQLPVRDLKIEFIGDSLTSGEGALAARDNMEWVTPWFTARGNYSWYACEALNAERSILSQSGWGVNWDYQHTETNNMSDAYEYTAGVLQGPEAEARGCRKPWDFSRWQPEKILVNLGTNDLSWVADREPRKDLFRKQYKEFLQEVRSKNPGAMILCVLGIMGTGLNDYMVKAVNEYRAEAGDNRIHSMTLQEQDMARDGCGSNYHPSAQTQRRLAEKVKYFIENA
jgi:lysophospholipase L1-like esterase